MTSLAQMHKEGHFGEVPSRQNKMNDIVEE